MGCKKMKSLFLTTHWLEFARLKQRLWLLAILLILFGISLGSCGDLAVQMTSSAEGPMQNPLLEQAPLAGFCAMALLGGYLILAFVPLRERAEWESGWFQMVAMGDYSFRQIEWVRMLWYLCLAAAYLLAVFILAGIYAVTEGFAMGFLLQLALVFCFWFAAFMPPTIALAQFLSAINTAYHFQPGGRSLTLVKNLGALAILLAFYRVATWLHGDAGGLLPPLQLDFYAPFNQMDGFNVSIHLQWELLVASIVLAAGLLVWSALILENVEA